VAAWQLLLAGLVAEAAATIAGPHGSPSVTDGDTLGDMELGPVIAAALAGPAPSGQDAGRRAAMAAALHHFPLPSSVASLAASEQAPALVRAMLAEEPICAAIGVNAWEGVTWFDRDAFEQALWWMCVLEGLAAPAAEVEVRLGAAEQLAAALAQAGEACGYQLDKLEAAAAAV
jgi:hypothetical protein